MARNKPFLLLKNDTVSEDKFNKVRLFKPPKQDDEQPTKIPKPFHQERIKTAYENLNLERTERAQARTINVPEHIDLLKIHFLTRFGNDLEKKFYKRYGLRVVSFEDFNKTVLFAIDDEKDFKAFKQHLVDFFESKPNKPYEGKAYALVALIQDIKFYSSRMRRSTFSHRLSSFGLIPFIDNRANTIYKALIKYLKEKEKTFIEDKFRSTIEIANISRTELKEILDNFDIIKSVTSSRFGKIRPRTYGPAVREYGFKVQPDSNNETVAVIDTGVNQIDPLKPILTNVGYDITSTGTPYWDENGHGTMVAGLVALGTDFLKEVKEEYKSKANIAVIKVLQNANDEFSINRLIETIIQARKQHNIRLFNLSLNDPIPKKYNSAFSDYAYLLDKIAYEHDLLIFISTGNLFEDHVQALQDEEHPSHEYPFHFYCVDNNSEIHSCESTNICAPAESLNNLTVGALADNFGNNYGAGITPAKDYPAFYTRKFHFDYTQTVNGTEFSKFQKNKFLNKPDLIFNGGDFLEKDAGIEVLTSPMADYDKYFSRAAGTSLAAPLIASMAAQIARRYPSLRTQTIKGLLINFAELPCSQNPKIFQPASLKGVLKKLTGFGKPEEDRLLFTTENDITLMIEDEIDLEEIRTIDISIPSYLSKNGNKLCFTATLCYSFEPLRDNHLNYCPLQIVFGFFRSCTPKQLGNESVEKYKIKDGLSWSEDTWSVENRLYSNVQHHDFNLNSDNLDSLKNKIALGIKCTGKKEIDSEHRQRLVKNSHPFSLIINIAEIPEAKASGDLYDDLVALNKTENITVLELDADNGDIELDNESL